MRSDAIFYEKIKKYGEDGSIHRFHMPGHKGRANFFGTGISRYDVTETNGTDNLFFPQKELIDAENRAAMLFGVKRTVFLAGGATLGNQTALSFFNGKKVLFERNIHISALNAAMLSDITPVFAYNGSDVATGVVLPISADEIEKKLDEEKDVSAVFITSPNYYGLCADLPKIKSICSHRGVKLIADNSHGAHLSFTGDIFSPLAAGSHCADITVDSAHKTLPSLTGAAMIHFNYDVSREDVCANMLAFASTSPSFLILSSLDYACEWCEKNREKFEEAKRRTDELKEKLESAGICVVRSEFYDPLRICIAAKNAAEIDKKLQNNGIIPEMQSGNCIVFMISPFNTEDDFSALKKTLLNTKIIPPEREERSFPKTVFARPLKTAFFGRKKGVLTEKSVGMIAARAVIPYPPGVPILIPGEIITRETADYLIMNKTEKVTVCEI